MRKTKLVEVKDLKIGDHFIYEGQENILCDVCDDININNDYKDICVIAYNINRNIVDIFDLEEEVVVIL